MLSAGYVGQKYHSATLNNCLSFVIRIGKIYY